MINNVYLIFKNSAKIMLILFLSILYSTMYSNSADTIQTNVPALKDVFANDFYIGCLLSYAHVGFPTDPYVQGQSNIAAPDGGNLIKYHMNSMSPGNWMKSTYIVDISGSASAYSSASTQEEKDSIDANPIVRFNGNIIAQLNWAKRQGFTFRGHTLVWHNQNPGTAFFRSGYTTDGIRLSKEQMSDRMENFIKEVVRILHEGWPGLLSAMDVVNEAVNDDGTDRTSNNEWYTTFGDNSYVMKAFEFARKYTIEYDETQMKLYYNDYNTHNSAKADGIVRVCEPIFQAGYLDGIGMQDHDGNSYPTAEQWIASYNKFDPICNEMAVTELDVTTGSANPSASVLQTQANQYGQLFKCFVERSYFSGRGKIITVAKDGLNDEWTFKKNQSSSLWDVENQCKPAFFAVVDVGNNYNGLDSLITFADSIESEQYTAESWSIFENTLSAAKNTIGQNYSASVSAADALGESLTELKISIDDLIKIAPPLVTNGSFEETEVGTVELDGINGWVLEVAATPAPDFSIVDNVSQDGNKSLKIVVNGIGTNPWDIQAIGDSIAVEPGQSYVYSIWAKTSNAGCQANFTVGNYAYNEYGVIRPANLSSDWQEFSFEFTITDEETYARAPIHFSIAANEGDTIYVDNLKIEKVGQAWQGPPLADGKVKFLGSAYSNAQALSFELYWNQVTPENDGKWGSVEGSRDVMNWGGLDAAYNLAKDNGFPFRFHVLIWGNQQPNWIESLSETEQLEEIEEWFSAVAERYPDIDFLEVVNEPLHDPPVGATNGNYINALGGDNDLYNTGWDWVIKSFELARQYFPESTKLMINDYSIVNDNSATSDYLEIINLLMERNLIDGIGVQGHAFSTRGSMSTITNNLTRLDETGLPIQVCELDIDGATDAVQLADYQEIFTTFWEHPGVEGITLWGWRPGLWRNDEQAYILDVDGSERPALVWLREYVDSAQVIVSVDNSDGEIPLVFNLENNYPNPFNPTTKINYSIPRSSIVSLKVYSSLGEEVAILVDGLKNAGSYSVTFDASNLASGIYLYQLVANDFIETKKLLLLK